MKDYFHKTANIIFNLYKKGRSNPALIYLISILSTFLALTLTFYLIKNNHQLQPLLLLTIPSSLNSWYAGLKSAVLSIFTISSSIAVLIFMPYLIPAFSPDEFFLTNFLVFIAVSLFLSFLIDASVQPGRKISREKIAREYSTLLSELEEKHKKALEEIKARDEFLTVATHELKTPVTSMLLQVQHAIHNIRNVSLAKFSVANLLQMLDSTEQQSKRLSKMVNDLLNTSLITTGRLDLELKECDLTKIVQDVSLRFSENLKRDNIKLNLQTGKPIIGKLDKLRMEQAIANLISNAIKYGLKKPINLKVTNSNSKARITIQDQGIGISKNQQQKIFGRFKRAVNSNEYKGLGVGLYITNQIAKAHNGNITVLSKPGKGTTFTLEVPLNKT